MDKVLPIQDYYPYSVEKGSEAKNWAHCLPRGFLETPQANCRKNQKKDGQSTQRQQLTQHMAPKGKKTGMHALPTQGAQARDGNRPGRDKKEKKKKAHFSKVLLLILLPICHYVHFRPPVGPLARNKRSETVLIASLMRNSTNGHW